MDFAQEYINATSQNLFNFSQPSIVFVFFDGITRSIASNCSYLIVKTMLPSIEELLVKEIQVVGPVYDDESTEEAPSPLQIMSMFRDTLSVTGRPISLPFDDSASKWSVSVVLFCCILFSISSLINLDISTMLAWVSSITRHSLKSELQYNVINKITDFILSLSLSF